MRLTHACCHAVLALTDIARRGGGRPRPGSLIALDAGVPAHAVPKVLRPFLANGTLESVRGPAGGYRFARPPSQVTLLEVVEAVDGPMPAGCDLEPDGLDCERLARLNAVVALAVSACREILANVTVADLAGVAGADENSRERSPDP